MLNPALDVTRLRKLFNVIMTDSQRTQALSPRSLVQLTDLQVAAFVWYLQMDNYLELIGGFPGATSNIF